MHWKTQRMDKFYMIIFSLQKRIAVKEMKKRRMQLIIYRTRYTFQTQKWPP